MEVPDYLQSNFRALENIAYCLKKKNSGLKRNVKLDDARLDVIMDIKLNDDSDWYTILPEHAVRASKEAP